MSLLKRRAFSDKDLLVSIKARMSDLETLLERITQEWVYEDYIYRMYHHSFKVYNLQGSTRAVINLLMELGDGQMNKLAEQIFSAGTGKTFELSHNQRWAEETRPIVEAFLHAKYFLEMAVKYGKQYEEAPNLLDSGWAGLLYLYNLR